MGRGHNAEAAETKVIGGETFKRGRRPAASSIRRAEPAEDFGLVGDWLENALQSTKTYQGANFVTAEDPWLHTAPARLEALYGRWQQSLAAQELFAPSEDELRLLSQLGPWLRKMAPGPTWMILAADDIAAYLGGSREIPE